MPCFENKFKEIEMDWNQIKEIEQLDDILKESDQRPILIFKHSTSCSISSVSLNRLDKSWKEESANNTKPYLLDLIQFRTVSNAIAERFNIQHASPQVLLIKNGECVYDESHFGIGFKAIAAQV